MYVYLIEFKMTNITKIGISSSPLKRLEIFKSANPYLVLTHVLIPIETTKSCAILLERNLHSYFSKYKLFKEWYNISSEDIYKEINNWKNIKEIISGNVWMDTYENTKYICATEKVVDWFKQHPQDIFISARKVSKKIKINRTTINQVQQKLRVDFSVGSCDNGVRRII